MNAASIAVLDCGKTNLKVLAAAATGEIVENISAANPLAEGPPWRHHDLKAAGAWLFAELSRLSRRHPIAHVVPVGHGSGGVLALSDPDEAGDGAALPMMDYEQLMPGEIDALYASLAGGFAERGSAIMMGSTHQARQLLRMEIEAPEAFAKARHYLNLPQYWAWRLSGVAVSEISMMAAQSHFWKVPEARFARIVAARGWARLFPPFAPAWTALGPVRPALARRFGLPTGLVVHTGAHDSSASFYRYQAAGLSDFTLVSTGTWIVALTDRADLARPEESLGRSLNADLSGRPVAGALSMGGREFDHIAGGAPGPARAEEIARMIARGTMALPSFGTNEGQFPGSAGRGRFAGPPPAEPAERRALAVIQAALLTWVCAASLGSAPNLVLDGTFLAEPLFAPLVAALRPGLRTEVSSERAGVAAGAALLPGHFARTAPVPLGLRSAEALPRDLAAFPDYARRWLSLAQGDPRP
jgi:sugar (pentulose or hexulose) kinase